MKIDSLRPITACIVVSVALLSAPAVFATRGPASNPVVSTLVNSFETSADLSHVSVASASATSTTQGVTDGSKALAITATTGLWPDAVVTLPSVQDWTNVGGLDADLYNPGSNPLSVNVQAFNSLKSGSTSWVWRITLAPGQQTHYTFATLDNPIAYGMARFPAEPNGTRVELGTAPSSFNVKSVLAIKFYLNNVTSGTTLIVDNLRTVGQPNQYSLTNIIDGYGQSNLGTWTNTVTYDSDLVNRAQTDSDALSATPSPEFDSYGGWINGPTLTATGWFRTTQYNNRWWLVTPTGHLFYSVGINSVYNWNSTIITNRSYMYAMLPATSDPTFGSLFQPITGVSQGPTTSGLTYDFNQANLIRKYGTKFQTPWQNETLNRLQNWGFNTIGNWSDTRVDAAHRMPYVATVAVSGSFKKIPVGRYGGTLMADPFDPKFAAIAAAAVAATAATAAIDPWCIGYFVDNELPWTVSGSDDPNADLAYGVLRTDQSVAPSKAEMVLYFTSEYTTIAALNKAWGTTYSSWTTFGQVNNAPNTLTSAARVDFANFTNLIALKYFSTIQSAIKLVDMHHLYLGCRFHAYSPTVAAAAAKYCDVISFNYYKPSLVASDWSFLTPLNKPALISEFSFGSTDAGMFNGGPCPVANQIARSTSYMDYVDSVTALPMFVGYHWFAYNDQPVPGRTADGENGNMGLIDVSDTAYSSLVSTITQVNRNIYTTIPGN